MKKIKLDISYLGSAYCGWQVQPGRPTVQKFMQNACEKALGVACEISGCSRTDSGVHAKSFICTARFSKEANSIPTEKLPIAINLLLPPDIRVKSAEEVSLDFHPRYWAKGKEYQYVFCDDSYQDPFLYGRVYFVPCKLDEQMMNLCAQRLVGSHDFAAFMASGSKITDTVRRIYGCTVERKDNLIILTVSGDGFLYNMVRIIAGTLLLAGKGDLNIDDMDKVIASKDRSLAGQTLPPQGLYLNKVFYSEKEGEPKYEKE